MLTLDRLEFIGGVVRWVLKGCKTKFGDEIHSRINSNSFIGNYEIENIIIGFLSIVIFLALIVILIVYDFI